MNNDYPVYARLSPQKLSQLGFDNYEPNEDTSVCPHYLIDLGIELCDLTDPNIQRCADCPDKNIEVE